MSRLPLAVLLVLLPAACRAAGCRFTLADQSEWDARRGFYLTLESAQPCGAAGLKLTLGVADGREWRFAVRTPEWRFGREYTVRAVIGPDSHELALDGELLARAEGGFVPARAVTLSAGATPEWAAASGEHIVTQTAFSVSQAGAHTAVLDFAMVPRAVPLLLLAPEPMRKLRWTAPPRAVCTLTAKFRLDPRPDAAAFVPYIDRYGQSAHARWPGKIASDQDLKDAATAEEKRLHEWGTPEGFDAYGGLKGTGWNEGRGFYRLKRRAGRWWLITPEGNPCFYIGLNTAPALVWDRTPVTGRPPGFFAELPPSAGPWAAIWGVNSWGQSDGAADVSFSAANLVRKFGPQWRERESELTARRVKAWGFSGLAKWASDGGTLPSIPVLSRRGVPNLVRHPDIFDPAIRRRFRDELARQILPRRDDPLVVGWSVGSEMEEIVTAAEIRELLEKKDSPAAKALGPAPANGDIEPQRRAYARAYYRFIYETVKELDPNHLYFGFWIVPGWWENEEDWRLAAPYCDAIGFDDYNETFAAPDIERLIRETDKPVLAGEFSFPPTYGLARGFRAYMVNAHDDRESGERYARWVAEALAHPFCVGVGWFQYRDQPVSGRGPGSGAALVEGESFAFGLVDVGDRPKWELVERVRATNLRAAARRWRSK